jgi:hypothetical protein
VTGLESWWEKEEDEDDKWHKLEILLRGLPQCSAIAVKYGGNHSALPSGTGTRQSARVTRGCKHIAMRFCSSTSDQRVFCERLGNDKKKHGENGREHYDGEREANRHLPLSIFVSGKNIKYFSHQQPFSAAA